ncbi:MAG: hypothetical protein ACI89E_001575 [Planctomycetota bacterium]|jgi:hypothetical protein
MATRTLQVIDRGLAQGANPYVTLTTQFLVLVLEQSTKRFAEVLGPTL